MQLRRIKSQTQYRFFNKVIVQINSLKGNKSVEEKADSCQPYFLKTSKTHFFLGEKAAERLWNV